MVLNPQDIHDKEFTVKMRGYSIDEVNDFLDRIIKDYQIIIKQNNELGTALKDTQTELKHYESMKDSLNQSILVAQEAADRLKKESKANSEKIISDANANAKKILSDANNKAKQQIDDSNAKVEKLLVESQALKRSTAAFRIKLQSLLQSQIDFAKSSTWDDLIKDNDANVNQIKERVLKTLDNPQASSVESKSNSETDDKKVVTFYPNGSFE